MLAKVRILDGLHHGRLTLPRLWKKMLLLLMLLLQLVIRWHILVSLCGQ